jgi:hypothetical protein
MTWRESGVVLGKRWENEMREFRTKKLPPERLPLIAAGLSLLRILRGKYENCR